jgi:MoaA/NifB/PqqE/SkfB family radical SAM enzyme
MDAHPFLAGMGGLVRSFFDVRRARAEVTAPATLPLLSLEMTLRCNARCGMCGYIRDYPRSGAELTTAELLAIVDEANSMGARIISLGGGEPLLRNDVMAIMRRIAAHGIVPFLHTNGSLLTHERCEELARLPRLLLALSLDSHRRETHDSMRGLKCFDSLLGAARYMAHHAPHVQVTLGFTITGKNYRDILGAARLARDVGVRIIRYTPFHENLQHRYRDAARLAPFRLSPEHLPEVRDLLLQVSAFTARNGMLTNSEAFLRAIPTYFEQPVAHRCYAGFMFCAIDPFGNLVPCYDHAGRVNVRDGGLRAAFHSAEMDRLRREVVTCHNRCWDMGQVEPSLRLDPAFLARHWPHILRETLFFLP